jgi:hypothetical protein
MVIPFIRIPTVLALMVVPPLPHAGEGPGVRASRRIQLCAHPFSSKHPLAPCLRQVL